MADANNPGGIPSSASPEEPSRASINGLPIRPELNMGTFRTSKTTPITNFDTLSRLTGRPLVGGGELRPKNNTAEVARLQAELEKKEKEKQLIVERTKIEARIDSSINELNRLITLSDKNGLEIPEAQEKINSLLEKRGLLATLTDLSTVEKELEEFSEFVESAHESIHETLVETAKKEISYKNFIEATEDYRRLLPLFQKVKVDLEQDLVDEFNRLEFLSSVVDEDGARKELEKHEGIDFEKTRVRLKEIEVLVLQLIAKKEAEVTAKIKQDELEAKNKAELGAKQAELEAKNKAELEAKQAELEAKNKEQIARIQKASRLLARFDTKKNVLHTLLLDPVLSSQKIITDALIKELEDLRATLESEKVTDENIDTFNQKVVALEEKERELEALLALEKRKVESMLVWYAEWPRSIKYEEAKKPNGKNPGSKGGWKKEGKMLNNQPEWNEANSLAKRVFETYNTLIKKSRAIKKEDEFIPLIQLKKSIIDALYEEKIKDAIVALNNLETLVETSQEKLEVLEQEHKEGKEKEEKSKETKKAFEKSFGEGKKYLATLKKEVESFSLSSAEKEGFERRIAELNNLANSFATATGDDAKNIATLFTAILGEFSWLIIKKIGDKKRIEDDIDILRAKLAGTKDWKAKRQLEDAIEILETKLKRMSSLDEGYKAINGGSRIRREPLHPIAKNAKITLRTRDPLTREKEISVGAWQARGNGVEAEENELDIKRRGEAKQILEETYKEMWERDKEAFKRFYVGRTWSPSEALTQEVVEALLNSEKENNEQKIKEGYEEKYTRYIEIEKELTTLYGEGTVGKNDISKQILKERIHALNEEKANLEGDSRFLELVKERRSLTTPATPAPPRFNSVVDNKQTLSPLHSKSFDYIPGPGVSRKTYNAATLERKKSVLRDNRGDVPGITTDVTGKDPLFKVSAMPIEETAGGREDFKAILPKEEKLEVGKDSPMGDGMTRSVDTKDKDLKINKGAEKIPQGAIERNKDVQVTSVITTVSSKFAKSWRNLVPLLAFAAAAVGTGIASAETSSSRTPTTIENILANKSWKDLLGSLTEREKADILEITKELSRSSKEVSYEDFINAFAPSLGLKDDGGNIDLSKKQALDSININELLNGTSAGIYADNDVRTQLSRIVVTLQKVHQIIEDDLAGKHVYQKRPYIYKNETLHFKDFFDVVRNLVARTK